jgi:hypothetical protein
MRAIFIVLAACTGTVEYTPDPAQPDPFTTLEQQQEGGPPRYTSRVHGCVKMRYATLGNLLASRGVDLTAADSLSAGAIYRGGEPSLGGPNFAARERENIAIGLATSAKQFDIFAQAAPEIIASIASRPECAGAPLFDGAGRCLARGISCLIGVPATPSHVDICNLTLARAADVESGKRLAVAVLTAAAHTCE